MVVRTLSRACAVLVVALVMTSQAAAQNGVTLKGRLLNSLNATPLSGATVQIDELRRQTTSEADGTFTFENVPPGTYHLSVLAQGYSTRRTEVRVAADAPPIELQVDFDLHFEEVVSVSGDARSQFDTFQPTSVLAGQELSKQLEMSLGATLESQPGVAARSFGPAPARPVIRGLDGDRVLILQDGAASRCRRTSLGRCRHTRRRSGEFAVAERVRQRRPVVDGRQFVLRRQLRLRRHEVRHPGDRGRAGAAHATATRVLSACRWAGLGRRVRLLSRDAGHSSLQARRARRRTSRYGVHQQHRGDRGNGFAPCARTSQGQRGRLGPEPRIRCHR